MLWLLLLSGSALKWAGLSPRAQHAFAVAQIFLSSGVVAAGIAAVVFSTAWGSLQCQVILFLTAAMLRFQREGLNTLLQIVCIMHARDGQVCLY